MLRLIAALCVLATASGGIAATHTIDLGGLRKAQAVISITNTDYDIRLRMLPVHVFDPQTNAQLNRDKARLYALQALAKHLADEKNVELVVSGAQVVKAGIDDKFYVLTLRVPRARVAVVRTGQTPPPSDKSPAAEKPERITLTSDLLSRKSDYLKTLEQLAASLAADLQDAEETSQKPSSEDGFPLAVAALEERGLTIFEKLDTSIQNDLLLLFTEKDELSERVVKQKKEFLNQLQAAVQRSETRARERNP